MPWALGSASARWECPPPLGSEPGWVPFWQSGDPAPGFGLLSPFSPLLSSSFPPALPRLSPPHSCLTSPSDLQYKLIALGRGGQAAGVQARSGPILGMTLGPAFSAGPRPRHRHRQGLLHTATAQWSRQKENVNSSPGTQGLFRQCPSLRGLGQAYCFPLGLSFHLCPPGKKSCSLPLKETRMDTGPF